MTTNPSVRPFGLLRSVILPLALLAAVTCLPHRSAALGSQATRYSGVIQAIDYKNKTVTFQTDPHGSSLSIGWNWSTTFYADGKRVKADDFKVGMRVKVKYFSPLFGREYATKIELDSSPVRPPG